MAEREQFMIQLTELLNKSQRYAEAIIRESGWSSYLLKKDGKIFEKPDNEHNQYRVGLIIRDGRLENYKVG